MYYYIRWLFTFLRTVVWFILQWPRFLFQRERVVQNSENPLSWERLKYHVFKDLLALPHTAKLGEKAPNCKVITLEGDMRCLFDFVKLSRPLVLNFGSCT
ncbi:Responsible for the deiodination of T4 (3,5,3',5'- tetraiodothyronine) [Desmophyllum pertusum]|uniref:Responsible for the deiodination of T4 (3,5,3',5'- tetraiodothyronine) n=1 Tax=Desmophyllum pertusum TaxID=174260 RepID=A0A9W9YNR0_9CNID|nr:Responsible for the deiodination of T4 (3,5,3',5'- tetraiodothyronine) [Desmophyllum pertusum]